MTFSSIVCIQFGLLRWTSPNKDIIVVVLENLGTLIGSTILLTIFLGFSSFYLLIHNQDFVMAMNSIIVLQEEVESVMECLDEAIIKKTPDGISFCNPVGQSILQNTYNILLSDKERAKHIQNSSREHKHGCSPTLNFMAHN